MLSYAVVDRDRERLVEELVVARQYVATPSAPSRTSRRRLFHARMALANVVRSHPVGA